MAETVWLTRAMLDVMHAELIAEHGGAAGVRADGDGLLESALARPRQKLVYDPGSDLPALAAAYLFGLAKNHGYVDGNKRIAFAAAATFLLVNGLRLTAAEPAAYDFVIGVAEGRFGEAEAAAWLRSNVAT